MSKCRGFIFESHCDHMTSKDVQNPHGQYQPNRKEKVSEDFWVCCKCGREKKVTLYEYY